MLKGKEPATHAGLANGCLWVYIWCMFPLDTLQITPEVLKLIAGIDEFKGTWRVWGTLAPERLRALRHVATIESIGSSTRIEGSKLSDREVERLLSNLEIGSFASRDEQEVAGYAEVMETVFRVWQDLPVTENGLRGSPAPMCAGFAPVSSPTSGSSRLGKRGWKRSAAAGDAKRRSNRSARASSPMSSARHSYRPDSHQLDTGLCFCYPEI